MAASAVLYSKDSRVVRILQAILSELSIQAEVAGDAERAAHCLRRQKYDAIFVDWDEQGADLLGSISRSKHNRKAVTFLISTEPVTIGSAFNLGAHFVLQKPLVVTKVKQMLKAAQGLMMREQRAYYRHPVSAQVSIRTEKKGLSGTLRDLNQGGALVECTDPPSRGSKLQLRFVLPETETVVEAAAKVIWSDPTGRMGVQFQDLSAGANQHLAGWAVARGMEEEAKEEVATQPPPAEIVAPIEVVVAEATTLEAKPVEPTPAPQPQPTPTVQATNVEARPRIRILGFESGRPVILEASCTRLDETGMSVELEDEVTLDSSVLLQLMLPQGKTSIVFHAEISKRDGLQLGFDFLKMKPDVHALLRTTLGESADSLSFL
jgi:PilZ domain